MPYPTKRTYAARKGPFIQGRKRYRRWLYGPRTLKGRGAYRVTSQKGYAVGQKVGRYLGGLGGSAAGLLAGTRYVSTPAAMSLAGALDRAKFFPEGKLAGGLAYAGTALGGESNLLILINRYSTRRSRSRSCRRLWWCHSRFENRRLGWQ